MNTNAEIFDKIVNERRSVRMYDPEAPFDASAVKRSLERAVLSPNSSNLQLWEFYRVHTPAKKKELAKYCLNQRAARTANELIVIVTRKDKWKKHAAFVLDESKKDFPEQPGKKEKLIIDYYTKVIPAMYFSDPLDIAGGLKKAAITATGAFRPIIRQVTAADVRVVVHKSAALAAVRVKKLLNLPAAAEINMIISVGTAKPEGLYGKRIRLPKEEVIFEI
jgi:nitroreductase